MKILFVENHSIFAQQVTNLFLTAHQVTVAPSLEVARALLSETSYDAVLVDYDLDDGKGDELVRELKTQTNIPRIIGVSAREDGNTALLQAGADVVCSKMQFDRIQKFI